MFHFDNDTWWDGKRIFGDNKTWQGFVGMSGLTALWFGIMGELASQWTWLREISLLPWDRHQTPYTELSYGMLWGFANVLFELPRRFGNRLYVVTFIFYPLTGWEAFYSFL
ncbi:hypothetical protein GK047_06395 [Paenibacillus sp. SYP-B3998]|uniref:Uncharacterized protein n=1 Tax=Paenibacillus sp. SYP-B3998 TaxID=2678564 RepID=A0A6G3ZUA8_9BACL|nr:hypothetical protein [Paenibacillus sp. SYP-B3998]NEW05650.1 hypothetical protein [Paenibacillus sp. SYP-B3998]